MGADGERIVELFQPEGVLDDARHVEVVRDSAGGDDEHVVRDDVAVVEHDAAPGGVDGNDAAHAHPDVASAGARPDDPAYRLGDLVAVEAGRSHLVEQRLERVEVVGIDQQDVERLIEQPTGDGEAAEPTTDDHDPSTVGRRSHPHSRMSRMAVVGEHHPAFEEYCECIFELAEDDVDVIQARIADRLAVSRPAVSEMMRRLDAEGLITTSNGIRLTERRTEHWGPRSCGATDWPSGS